jgi:acetyl-CoA synthetase
MIEKYGVNVFYTSPTAIRGLMRFGASWAEKHDLSSLRLLGSVGEPINPEAWKWYYKVIGNEKCPIMDTWWQTETGGFMITPLPVIPLKPGSATKPFFGNEMAIVDEDGKEVPDETEGNLIIKNPWPGMARTILGDPDRFIEKYWEKYSAQGWYLTGDSARRDKDGYYWIIGRNDDVIKVSGYRLGSAEIESALVSHPAVTEAAAVGLPDQLKGNIIHASVILKQGFEADDKLSNELKKHVENEIGPIAKPGVIEFVESLPKTRSGKIMRRVLKARAMGQEVGDLTTLED